MKPQTRLNSLMSLVFVSSLVTACSSGGSDSNTTDPGDTTALGSLDPTNFSANGLATDITTEECVLSGGTTTTCYRITTAGSPADTAVGPFCPPTITSTAEAGGIWFDGNGTIYDIDGPFIENLATTYNDATWQLYDAEGNVYITDTEAKFEGAAQPNIATEFQQQCVAGQMEWVDGGVSATFLIPATPVALSTPDDLSGNIGVSLNGIQLAAAAPVDAILAGYTIAAFDDCGGHINPTDGYHYHGSTGCTETGTQGDGHAALLGYAMDGYGIYGMLDSDGNESTNLDECRGETDDIRGYHYHSASAAENMFIGCFHGERVAQTGGTGPENGPPAGPPQ